MKKLLSLTLGLTLLSACSSYEPDMDEAAKQRALNREEIRNTVGCQFVDDHAAYRKCVIATYESNRPKTFTTTTSTDGQSVAVVSSGELKPSDPSMFVSSTTTTSNATGSVTASNTVLMGNALPGSAAPCTYQTQEMYEVQLPAQPCTTCAPVPVAEAPKIVTVSTTETVTEKPIEVVPAPAPLPEKTWWETYQEAKPVPQPSVVCPCPDPNDPCPQCVTK